LTEVIERNKYIVGILTSRVAISCKNGRIKPDELENALHGICADECSGDEVTIHKLEERAEVENSHAVDTRTDQSGSDEEIPATSAESATSISWTYDISPHIF
jgi:hypothetical protein